MIVNTAQGGGGSLPLNLHVQPDEPPVKEGLWIKAPEKHAVKQITTKDSFVIGETLRNTKGFTNLHTNDPKSGYLVDDHYLYYFNHESTNVATTFPVYLYRYDFTTNTLNSVVIYNYRETTQHYFYEIRHSFIYKLNGKIHFRMAADFDNTQPEMYHGFEGEFDPETFTSLGHIDTEAESTCVNYLANLPIAAKNNDCAILQRSTVDGYMSLYKFDFQTTTVTQIVSANRPNDTYYPNNICGIQNNVLYYNCDYVYGSGSCTIDHLNRYDLLNDSAMSSLTLTSGSYLPLSTSNLSFWQMLPYQNKFIIPIVSEFEVLDLATLTTRGYYPLTWNSVSILYKSMFLFHYTGDSDNLYRILDFQSETLDQNQLAILNGRDYNYKLISTSKMNLRAALSNVWWYDTDFKEYPTYIGDGTKFNKIKN